MTFFLALLVAQQFGRLLPLSLGEITDLVNPRVAPAGYAFSIWGLIYSLITGFVVYQALPSSWVPGRNDDLIFNKMSYAFVVNMFTQMTWFFLFQSYTGWGFIISSFDIGLMLATAVYMMMVSTRQVVNWWEAVFIRGGMTIYSGWLTTATILNIVIALKFLGVKDPDIPITEEITSIILLYVAAIIYNLASYIELNPLYGAVFIWVVYAIRNEILELKPGNDDLLVNLDILGVFQSISMTALVSYLAAEAIYDVSDSTRGLFYY